MCCVCDGCDCGCHDWVLSDVDYGGGEGKLHGSFEVQPNRDRRLPQDDTIISQHRFQVRACIVDICGHVVVRVITPSHTTSVPSPHVEKKREWKTMEDPGKSKHRCHE